LGEEAQKKGRPKQESEEIQPKRMPNEKTAIRSPFSGRKPRRREDTSQKPTAKMTRVLANPALEGKFRDKGEERSIGIQRRSSL
jgi:hypothetical protein